MGEAGLFADERVELLDGTIVTMSPQSSLHAATVHRLHRLLSRALADTMDVRMQLPVGLDDWSEPEPDVVACRADPHDYARGHPQPQDIVMICEVAVSSLGYDQTGKAAAYAARAIPVYWIVDVERRVVHVIDDPDPATRRFRRERQVGEGAVIDGPNGTSYSVADVLPAR